MKQPKMKLLTFAHRGEAQHFLKFDNYKSLDFEFNGLYKNEVNYLLITGEGFESTNKKMNAFLIKTNLFISCVINLGIAGALDSILDLESIHSVKLIKNENEIETFQSSDVYANIECISALNSVLDETYKKKLSKRAQIVDRELWACAKVCNKYKVPIYSFKLISDHAGSEISLDKIIQHSKKYSKKLFDFYHEFIIKQDI